MKSLVKLLPGFILLFLILGVSAAPRGAQRAVALRLEGAEASEFLAQSGILPQLAKEIAPPQGRFFMSPQPYNANDITADNNIGYDLSIDGDLLAAGALGATVDGTPLKGAAYVFRREGDGWVQEQKVVAPDGAAEEKFGFSVALNGSTLLVGAVEAKVGNNTDQGAAYVFVRSGTMWTFQQKLTAADGTPFAYFGSAVDLEGDTAVVGAGSVVVAGAAYVFTRSGNTWTFQQKLAASDGEVDDGFGNAVDISGNTIAAAANHAPIGNTTNQGAVYLFEQAGGSWSETKKLFNSNGTSAENYGGSLALEGDTLLVSAESADPGAVTNRGAVFAYQRSGANWNPAGSLEPGDLEGQDRFGRDLAVSGDTAVVSSVSALPGGDDYGAVYVFTREGGSWSSSQKLIASFPSSSPGFGYSVDLSGETAVAGSPFSIVDGKIDSGQFFVMERLPVPWQPQGSVTPDDGALSPWFSFSVAVSGDFAAIGAPLGKVGNNENQGAVFVFVRNGPAWVQQKKLTAADGGEDDFLGISVDIDGDTIVAGANAADVDLNLDQGAAYVFFYENGVWSEQDKLLATGGQANDYLGYRVAVDGDTAVVTAPDFPADTDPPGAAFVFTRSGGSWAQEKELLADDGAPEDYFGSSVAVSGDTVVVGASSAAVNGKSMQGAAYVFVRDGGAWPKQQKLIASDGEAENFFGSAVGLDGNRAVVGAPLAVPDGGHTEQGLVYVFERSGSIWTETEKLEAPDAASYRHLGLSLAIDGSTMLAGSSQSEQVARNAIANYTPGAVYVFSLKNDAWRVEQKLVPADGQAGDLFGYSVDLDGTTAVVGAYFAFLDNVINQGHAYFYERQMLEQTIDFPAPPDGSPGDGVPLQAVASSGLPVSYQADTADTCTVTGSTAHLLAVGLCRITAYNLGDEDYLGAETDASFQVVEAAEGQKTLYLPSVVRE